MTNSAQTRPNNFELLSGYNIAILIPCFNEAKTVAKVVEDFRAVLPMAKIYVYDNNSSDDTTKVAIDAGAIVRYEPRQGKGYAVKRMFADIGADIYLMVDGDATYDASVASAACLKLIENDLDMVLVARKETAPEAYSFGHIFGNLFSTRLMRFVVGGNVSDILSGYRAFSRRFVKSLPLEAKGFEIEAEITIYAIRLQIPSAEITAPYFPRPSGSTSKFKTLADSWRILTRTFYYSLQNKPMFIASGLSLFLLLIFIITLVFFLFNHGNYQNKIIEIVIMAAALMASLSSLVSGVILHAIAQLRLNEIQLKYKSYPGVLKENSGK